MSIEREQIAVGAHVRGGLSWGEIVKVEPDGFVIVRWPDIGGLEFRYLYNPQFRRLEHAPYPVPRTRRRWRASETGGER